MSKKWTEITIATILFLTSFLIHDHQSSPVHAQTREKHAQNVILLIPDGFSSSQATNYRWFKGKETIFDAMLVGMQRTYSANSKVTDSAAAATAMATGTKTNNGLIGVDSEGKKLTTILEAANRCGKSTGLVSTSTITHATPAAFATHVGARAKESDIARQLIPKVDVLLGGGKQFFLPQSAGGKQPQRNLIKEAKNKDYQFIETRHQLQHTRGSKLLGLFSNSHLSPELHRPETKEPSLSEMTTRAIHTLSTNKKGFFLMIEGSQIDFAGHAHDSTWSMNEIAAFEKAAQKAIHFAKKDGHTLVVITGDHETGGMSVGGYNQYKANIELLRNITATGETMAKKLTPARDNAQQIIKAYAGIDITAEEAAKIQASPHLATTINDIISNYALIGWTTHVHTGQDVPLYAFGVGSYLFNGLHENTDLPKLMAQAMEIPFSQ
nr:alkaline phosphatase [Marininema mesophilum]